MRFLLHLCIALLAIACSNAAQNGLSEPPIEPTAYMNDEAAQEFLYSISRYICKYPAEVGERNKWESRFDTAYAKAVKAQQLRYYYVDSVSGTHYFFISRIAPSIHEKYVGLAGKFTPTEHDPLAGYEEVFRTWKMFPDEHKEKSAMLFRKFISGKDLSPYYTVNSGGVEYIEFPDQETWYDTTQKIWRSERDALLEPYKVRKQPS